MSIYTTSIQHYLDTIKSRYAAGISTEHSYEDILHYQKIIKAMVLTDEIMQETDKTVSWK